MILADVYHPVEGLPPGPAESDRDILDGILRVVDCVRDPADDMNRMGSVGGGRRGACFGGDEQGSTAVRSPPDQASVVNRKHLRSSLILVPASVDARPAAWPIDRVRRRRMTGEAGQMEKNWPTTGPRMRTSPLLTRNPVDWPVGSRPRPIFSLGPGHLSGERASGGSCEASRSPFGGELAPVGTATPMGWMLLSWFVKSAGLVLFLLSATSVRRVRGIARPVPEADSFSE